MYSANLNTTNPVGTIQSIEHTLRNLDKLAADQQARVVRVEKELADYKLQCDRPFEHEERLKELLARQSELADLLDLDKGDQQAVDSTPEPADDLAGERDAVAAKAVPLSISEIAKAYMRQSGEAIRDVPIVERKPPDIGTLAGKAVARTETHVAVATAANSFCVVPSIALGRDVEIGERLSLRFQRGLPSLDDDRTRAR